MALTVRKLEPIAGIVPQMTNANTRIVSDPANSRPIPPAPVQHNFWGDVGNWANQNLIQPVVHTGEKTVNQLGATGAALFGAADVSLNHGSQSAQDRTRANIDYFLGKGLGGVGGYQRPETVGSGNIGSFVKPIVQATSEIAPLVIPFGKVAEAASLPVRMAAQGGINAGVSGVTNVASQLADTGKVDPMEAAKATLFGGVFGAAVPAAGAVLGKARVSLKGKPVEPEAIPTRTDIPVTDVPGETGVPVNVKAPGEAIRFDAQAGARNAVKSPNLAKEVTESALNTKSPDPLNVMLDVLTNATTKGKVRHVVEQMGIPVEGNVKNRLVKALTTAKTPQEVATAIRSHLDEQATTNASKPAAPAAGLKGADKMQLDYLDNKAKVEFLSNEEKQQRAALKEQAAPGTNNIKRIHILAQKRGLTDEQYRGVLQETTGKTSTTEMTQAEHQTVIKALSPKVVEKPKVALPTPEELGDPRKAPGVISRFFEGTRDWIAKHGVAGQEVAQRLKNARDFSEVDQEAFIEQIPSVLKLNKNDLTTFVDSLDGLARGEKIPRPPEHIVQAIQEWSQAIPKIRDLATHAGLDVGDLGEYYFPREYKDLANGKNIDKYVSELLKSGQAKTRGEAMGMLNFMQREYTRPYGHLEKSRLGDLPGYEKTHEALLNYISRSFDRIGKAREFGPKNEILEELNARAAQDGYRVGSGTEYDRQLKIALGDVDHTTTAHRISGGIRKFNATTSLSTAGISNASQLTNTATVGGIGRTVVGVVKSLASKEARARAKQTGVLLDHTVNEYAAQGLGTSGKISSNIASPFFRTIEKFNRQTTAIVGEDWGNTLAKRAFKGNAKSEQILREKLGVTGDIGRRLTRKQQIQASRALVEISQFKVDPQDIPGLFDSPIGKLVAQFRTFGYKQTQFMWTHVLKEAGKGNFLPLARFVALGVPVGAATGVLKDYVKQKPVGDDNKTTWNPVDYITNDLTDMAKNPLGSALKGFMNVGGLGLPGSEINNVNTGIQYDNLPGALAGTVGGPTASFATEAATNIQKAIGGNARPLEKMVVRKIPAAGPTAANLLFPNQSFTPGKTDPGTLSPADLKKYEGATYNEFNKGLSPEEQRIFGLQQNHDAGSLAIKNGKVTQDQLDEMQAKYNRAKLAVGLPLDYVNSVTQDEFQQYDKATQDLITEASLTTKKKFTDNKTVAKTSEAVVDNAKKNAWPNIGDIKATNKLALDYVTTLQDMKKAGDDTGKQYELYKGYWKGAVKAQYNDTVTAGYGSSIADLRRLSAGVTLNGKTYGVNRSDLDKMVELDNRLLISGLIDTPKFSNKVRGEAGYGEAPASKTDGVGYAPSSSGSGGKAAINPYGFEAKRGSVSVNLKAPALAKKSVAYTSSKKTTQKPKVSLKKATA